MTTPSVPKTAKSSETGTPTPARSMATHKVTPVPVPKPGSIPSLPPSANHAAAVARAASSTVTSALGQGAAQSGFGLLNPVEANLQDAASGSHRDGRIRNPVPSKLKGKTDGSKGNFSVLHMDVTGRSEATERDAQAKRTSESTELAAKRAYENGYVSLRRSRFVQVPDETTEPAQPPPPPKPFIPAPVSTPATTSTSAPVPSTRRSPLNAEETKSEQARLLTLLRSLHPVLVIDQICKALAFFGGIPGAPPPVDGAFPQSAEANGSGSLFVGWIAEIFPKLGGNTAQPVLSPVRQSDGPEVTRRRRGRPKGSKATKTRKDKGIRKGPTKSLSGVGQSQPNVTGDESWVDVEDVDDDGGAEVSENTDANVILLAQASITDPRTQRSSVQQDPQQQASQVASTPVRTALPGTSGNSESHVDGTSSVKKRGRPKGSKNRPKDMPPVSSDQGAVPQIPQEIGGVNSPYISGQGSQTPHGTQDLVANPSFTAVNSHSAITTPAKKKTPRSKGQATKPKSDKQPGLESSGGLPAVGAVTSITPNTYSLTQTHPEPPTEPSNHVNQAQTYQNSQSLHASLQLPVTTAQVQQTTGNATQKRKRKTGKEPNIHQPGANGGVTAPGAPSSQANGLTLPVTPSSNQSPQAIGSSLTIGPPPAKRARKSLDPKSSAKKQNDTVPATSAKRQTPVSTSMISPAPPPNPSPTPVPVSVPVPVTTPIPASGPSSAHISPPISVEPTISSIPSPHHTHFEVQSPTIENYEAQLQAQLEQQTESESQPLSAQGRLDPRHLIPGRLHHQQQQQQQHHLQQRQQQMQAQQGQQQHQPSVSHTRSPNLQSQPQTTKSQPENPISTQQQARQSHSQQYSQYRSTNTQYGQQQQSQEQQDHKQQQQQNYSSPQHPQQHFTTHQQTTSVSGQPHQYSTSSQQTPQYTSSQQPYTSSQHQYSSGQQHVASQQRYQQLGTSSASTASYTAHQPSQFGTSTTTSFNPTDGAYRTSTAAMNNPSYVPQRSQSATPSATAAYRATGGHGLSHHSQPFNTNPGTGQHRSTSASHSTSQSVQGMAGVASFSGGAAADWALFETTNLDATENQGTLGLNNANYSINAGNVRASQNTGAAFSTNALTNFDTSGLGGSDRYYGIQRR